MFFPHSFSAAQVHIAGGQWGLIMVTVQPSKCNEVREEGG